MPLSRRFATYLAVSVLLWTVLALYLDGYVTISGQRMIGILTWLILIAWLTKIPALVRIQTLIVVAFASLIEYTFAGYFGVYQYRLENVPWFVPPGHGLIYLGAVALGVLMQNRIRTMMFVLLIPLTLWVIWGLFISPRLDVLGAFWFLNLLAFLKWGPSRPTYLGAIITVSWLEIVGTYLGTWAWEPFDTIAGWVAQGNPPSGAAGGYGWFDLVGMLAAPWMLRRLGRKF